MLTRLEQDCREVGKAELFQRLRDFLVVGTGDETCVHAAAELGMTSEAVKKAVHRLRRRYSELVREEIARTVADAAAVEDELRPLSAVLADDSAPTAHPSLLAPSSGDCELLEEIGRGGMGVLFKAGRLPANSGSWAPTTPACCSPRT